MACRWEYEEMHSIDTARTFAVKGLQRHPTCHQLYVDAFRMELKAAENMDEEKRVDNMLITLFLLLKRSLLDSPDDAVL